MSLNIVQLFILKKHVEKILSMYVTDSFFDIKSKLFGRVNEVFIYQNPQTLII
jgi:hypothetical protein